jgi:hypothetical protein
MIAHINYEGERKSLEYEILAPSLYVYKNVLPSEWNLINRIEKSLLMSGTPYSWKPANVSYSDNIPEHRNCKDFKINESILGPRTEYNTDLLDVHADIMRSLKACMQHYVSENYLDTISYYECINIVKYGKGEYFKVHSDDGEPYRCTVSAVGYPNDNYAGGEISFAKFDITYKPQAGDFVIFPSSYAYAHASEPVTDDGTKYSFVIMSDRTEFAHRADSPVYYDKDYRMSNGARG